MQFNIVRYGNYSVKIYCLQEYWTRHGLNGTREWAATASGENKNSAGRLQRNDEFRRNVSDYAKVPRLNCSAFPFFALYAHTCHTYGRHIAKNCDNRKCPKIVCSCAKSFSLILIALNGVHRASHTHTHMHGNHVALVTRGEKLIVSAHHHSTFATSPLCVPNKTVHYIYFGITSSLKFSFSAISPSSLSWLFRWKVQSRASSTTV